MARVLDGGGFAGPLVLRYRLVILKGEADEAALQKLWADYAGAEK